MLKYQVWVPLFLMLKCTTQEVRPTMRLHCLENVLLAFLPCVGHRLQAPVVPGGPSVRPTQVKRAVHPTTGGKAHSDEAGSCTILGQYLEASCHRRGVGVQGWPQGASGWGLGGPGANNWPGPGWQP